MHNPHVFPAGLAPAELVPTPGRIRQLDQLSSELWNAAEGGTAAPDERIWIGGAGLKIARDVGDGSSVLMSGEVRTGRAGALVLEANNYPQFQTPRTATRHAAIVPINRFAFATSFTPVADAVQVVRSPRWGVRIAKAWDGGGIPTIVARIPSRLLAPQATLTRVRLRMRVVARPAVMPSVFPIVPMFRVLRVEATGLAPLGLDFTPINFAEVYKIPTWQASPHVYAVGDVVVPTASNGRQYRCTVGHVAAAVQPAWTTTLGGLLNDGSNTWRCEPGPPNSVEHYAQLPYPTNGAPSAYYASGKDQEIILPVNLNTTVDTKTYSYLVQIFDPAGQSNIFHSLSVDVSNIPDMRPW